MRHPPTIIMLWRKTALCWRAYMRRFARLWLETRRTSHPEEARVYLGQAINARDHWRRALEKADSMERDARQGGAK